MMASKPQLRCVIAAGGTAGHVIPSLAVAQALRARGVSVSFAGSPDRIEARLVPQAGFELDPFEISGLPRRYPHGNAVYIYGSHFLRYVFDRFGDDAQR